MSMLDTPKYRLLLLGFVRASKQMPPSSWAAPLWLAHHTHHENALSGGKGAHNLAGAVPRFVSMAKSMHLLTGKSSMACALFSDMASCLCRFT